MADYLADIRKYDATADTAIVDRIVKHLGIALRSRDASLVSCSDPDELRRVREKWCEKRLGVFEPERCDAIVQLVCETMVGDNAKSRVTFYYLVAKHLGKLSTL